MTAGDRWVDRTGWADGPWRDEPDYAQWVAPNGLVCFAVRSVWSGSWLAYVCLPPGHPGWGVDFRDEGDLDVHGGVTYAAPPAWPDFPRMLGGGADLWLVGFDCVHGGDVSPGLEARLRALGYDDVAARFPGDTYQTLATVQAWTDDLAAQLGPAPPAPVAPDADAGP